jgi:hypothetical protein
VCEESTTVNITKDLEVANKIELKENDYLHVLPDDDEINNCI